MQMFWGGGRRGLGSKILTQEFSVKQLSFLRFNNSEDTNL